MQPLGRTKWRNTIHQEKLQHHVREDYAPKRRSYKERTEGTHGAQRRRDSNSLLEQEAEELTNAGRYERRA